MNKETRLMNHLPIKGKRIMLKNGLVMWTTGDYLNVTRKPDIHILKVTSEFANFTITPTTLIDSNTPMIWSIFTLHIGDVLGFEEFERSE